MQSIKLVIQKGGKKHLDAVVARIAHQHGAVSVQRDTRRFVEPTVTRRPRLLPKTELQVALLVANVHPVPAWNTDLRKKLHFSTKNNI